MNEKEKDTLRELKAAKVAELQQCARRRSKKLAQVWKTDPRLRQYVKSVAAHPEAHNVWEICAVVRFYDLLSRHEWHVKRARLIISQQETYRHQTDQGLKRVQLEPVQVFMCAVPYGLVDRYKVTERDPLTGQEVTEERVRRVIRSVVWMVPRKFGKTTLISGFGNTEFWFGPKDAEVDIVSTTGRQAKICFNMIKTSMMDLVANEISLSRVKLRFNRESIFYENPLDGAQSINVYGDNPDALNGLKPSLAIEDESASFADTPSKAANESRNTLESGQGTRAEPLSFQITTASKYVNGSFAQSLNGIKRVLAGQTRDDSLFAILFCPDVDDAEDDPATWRKCHPMLGVSVQADYYEREWQKCMSNKNYLNEFRTKLLNVFDVPLSAAWIPRTTLAKFMVDWDPLQLPVGSGVRAMIGVDLAQKWDFAAVSVAVYREDLRQTWVHTKCFIPDGIQVWMVPRTPENEAYYLDPSNEASRKVWKTDETVIYLENAPFDNDLHSGHPNTGIYRHWIESGELTVTHGEVVDYDVVAHYIFELSQHLDVRKIGYDDYKWREFANYLARLGGSDSLFAFGQTYGDFTAPTIYFEKMLTQGSIVMAKSDLVLWTFDNAVLDTDARSNCKPMKLGEYNRIDPVITCIMACGLWSDLGHTRHNRNDFED